MYTIRKDYGLDFNRESNSGSNREFYREFNSGSNSRSNREFYTESNRESNCLSRVLLNFRIICISIKKCLFKKISSKFLNYLSLFKIFYKIFLNRLKFYKQLLIFDF